MTDAVGEIAKISTGTVIQFTAPFGEGGNPHYNRLTQGLGNMAKVIGETTKVMLEGTPCSAYTKNSYQ